MFHLKPAAQGILLGALLSGAAALAQTGAENPSSSDWSEVSATPKKAIGGAAGKGTRTKPAKRDPRLVGLGRSCTKRADCSSKAQVCLRQQDQRGKMLPRGFCALPCAKIEQGLTPTRPGFPARDRDTTDKLLKKPPPPRCPPPFKCRSKGGDISIDLCVRE
jgi:hypothetical protein